MLAPDRERVFADHAAHPGARAMGVFPAPTGRPAGLLRRGRDADPAVDPLLAMAYGFDATPGTAWLERVRPELTAAGTAGLLLDAFEVAEVAVLPGAQGRGLGGAVLDALVAATGRRVVLLGVYTGNERALRLYGRRGFVRATAPFHYSPGDLPYAVMALVRGGEPARRPG